MAEPVPVTIGVARILAVLLADPEQGRYGLELMRTTGQPSGTLYPILLRLQAAGWVRAEWEDIDPAVQARPARRYYRLTRDGAALARSELAELSAGLRLDTRGVSATFGTLASTPARAW